MVSPSFVVLVGSQVNTQSGPLLMVGIIGRIGHRVSLSAKQVGRLLFTIKVPVKRKLSLYAFVVGFTVNSFILGQYVLSQGFLTSCSVVVGGGVEVVVGVDALDLWPG